MAKIETFSELLAWKGVSSVTFGVTFKNKKVTPKVTLESNTLGRGFRSMFLTLNPESG